MTVHLKSLSEMDVGVGWGGGGKPSGYLQVQDTSQTFRRNHGRKPAVQSVFRYVHKLWVLASPKRMHLHQPRSDRSLRCICPHPCLNSTAKNRGFVTHGQQVAF